MEGDEFYRSVQQFIRNEYGGTSVPVSTICREDYMVQAGISRLAPSPIIGRAGVTRGTELSRPTAEGSWPHSSKLVQLLGARNRTLGRTHRDRAFPIASNYFVMRTDFRLFHFRRDDEVHARLPHFEAIAGDQVQEVHHSDG